MSKLRVLLVRYRGVPPIRNMALWQRVQTLSTGYLCTILTSHSAMVDPQLATSCEVLRPPWNLTTGADSPFRYPSRLADMVLFFLWSFLVILRRKRTKQLDIIYTFQDQDAVVGWLSKLVGIAWILDILDFPSYFRDVALELRRGRYYALSFVYHLFYMVMRRFISHADLLPVIAANMDSGLAKRLITEYGIPSEKIVPLTNGVDTTHTKPKVVPKSNPSDFLVLYVGAVSESRGTTVLCSAVERARQHVPEVKLILVGGVDVAYKDELEELIDLSNLRGTVRVLGQLPHHVVLDHLSSADVCVYPFQHLDSCEDVLPIKVFEYLAMGKAVVVSDLEGVCHIIQDRFNGLIVPAANRESWARAIVLLSRDNTLRHTLEENAIKTSVKYDWRNINSKLAESINRRFQPL